MFCLSLYEPVAELKSSVFQPELTRHDFDADSGMGTSTITEDSMDDRSTCIFTNEEVSEFV